jgi:hypothetical protein
VDSLGRVSGSRAAAGDGNEYHAIDVELTEGQLASFPICNLKMTRRTQESFHITSARQNGKTLLEAL